MNNPFVEWNDRYSVGVGTVDKQHMGLITLTNELYEACQTENPALNKHFKDTLQKAISYANMHFGTEEKIMTQTQDPNISAHLDEHNAFVKKILEGAATLETSPKSTSEDFVRFLRDWILNHVATTDVKIGQHISQLKEKGVLKMDDEF